jgi:hypothetical protein
MYSSDLQGLQNLRNYAAGALRAQAVRQPQVNTSDLGYYPPRAICVVLTKTDAAPHPMANCFHGMLGPILATNVNAACFPKRAHQENGYDNSNDGSPRPGNSAGCSR